MTLIKILSAAAALLSLSGGVCLAFALARLIRAYEHSFDALEMSVHALAKGEEAPVFESTDSVRAKASAANRWLTGVGVISLCLSAVLSLGVVLGLWRG